MKNNIYLYSTLLNQIYNHFFNGQFFWAGCFLKEKHACRNTAAHGEACPMDAGIT
jgi:hypothetical protein